MEKEIQINKKTTKEVTICSKLDFTKGFNSDKSLYPFNEKDMIEFNEWCFENTHKYLGNKNWFTKDINKEIKTTKELLDIFISQRVEAIFYE